MADGVVEDVPEESRFVYREHGAEAELVYRRNGKRFILVHTGVPDELGGKGLGGMLVEAALDRAKQEGLTVVPWCSFARGWLQRHPDATVGVTIDWDTQPPPPH
jgi:predicted GNAT family acetyltransferase